MSAVSGLLSAATAEAIPRIYNFARDIFAFQARAMEMFGDSGGAHDAVARHPFHQVDEMHRQLHETPAAGLRRGSAPCRLTFECLL